MFFIILGLFYGLGAKTIKNNEVLIVCDRGMMDSKAYLSDLEFATVLNEIKENEIELRDNYDAVFHLVTAAKGAEEFYTLENKEMNFHYRTSFLQTHPEYICLEAVIKLTKGDKNALDEVIKEINEMKHLFGQGVKEPYICVKNVDIYADNVFIMGKNLDCWKFTDDEGFAIVNFGIDKENDFVLNAYENNKHGYLGTIDIVGRTDISEYKGILTPQFVVSDYMVRSEG